MQKEEQFLEKRLIELSKIAYNRNIVMFSDFLNLNELNILHTIPKNQLYSEYITFGGYEDAERQMAVFLPDALSLRTGNSEIEAEVLKEIYDEKIAVIRVTPVHEKYAEELTHRDYLGAVLNLGIERKNVGDIILMDQDAYFFVKPQLAEMLCDELTRIRHTFVIVQRVEMQDFQYEPKYKEIIGTVASLRLDCLLGLAYSSSRSKLKGLIEAGKVFVNGKLITSNGYHIKDDDIISVRGIGKFRFVKQMAVTKKNRISVLLYLYV